MGHFSTELNMPPEADNGYGTLNILQSLMFYLSNVFSGVIFINNSFYLNLSLGLNGDRDGVMYALSLEIMAAPIRTADK